MWEGMSQCLKWYNVKTIYSLYFSWFEHINQYFLFKFIFSIFFSENISTFIGVLIPFLTKGQIKLNSSHRIGPHNKDILSIIIGSVLGDSHLEKRNNGLGTRIIFEQSNKNVEYLMWFHNYLASKGYCSIQKPKLHTRIKKDNKVFYHFRLNSYTFSSFNWIHEMFYIKNSINNKLVKIVPLNIEKYLTPLALAIWFMDDGSKLKPGVRIATNNFSFKEVQFLCLILYKKYNLIATVHTGGKDKGYVLYINKKSVPLFISLVKHHMVPSLYYKLGI